MIITISNEWNFGEDLILANKLKQLVLNGNKTAATGLYNRKVSMVGDYEAILDSNQNRFCIIRITNVEVKPFLNVNYEFVQKEGEGDEDVESWRKKHRKFFNLKNDGVDVVCLEFEVVKIL